MDKAYKSSFADMRTISLIVTERCNLSCVYCYEREKHSVDMTFAQAKKIIDKEFKERRPAENTYLEFFGGEPFLNFELIKQVYEYIRSFYCGKIRFFATTNGTLIHGEIADWIEAHKDNFSVGLSLDGTRAAHDINRSNSFDSIDIDFFRKNYPKQPVKMTVSELSLPYLAESVKYLTELGFEVACNLAYMVDWTAESNKKILEEQLNDLIDWYVDRPEIKRCTLLNFNISVLSRPAVVRGTVKKYCGTGTAMVCYDANGEAYPCQLFAPISAKDKAMTVAQADIRDDHEVAALDEMCRGCYYLRICPFCLGSNYISTGNFYRPDRVRCELYKTIFAANAKLKALEWERGYTKNGDEEQALLRSIAVILNIDER